MVQSKVVVADVDPQHYFMFKGYGCVKNIAQMIVALHTVSLQDFQHHVNAQRNDIATWVKDIHQDETLALALQKAYDRYTLIDILDATLRVGINQTLKTLPQEEQPMNTNQTSPHESKNTNDKLEKIDKHIERLEQALAHSFKKATTLEQKEPKLQEPMHDSIYKGMMEFAFGLAVGLIIGLLLAKVLGWF
ncbi:MAG: hypothetical protein ACMXYC_03510 [Candidatus Woesearchaeota archaeon]